MPQTADADPPRRAPVPASAPQRRLWFLHQLEPASPAYNMPAAVRLLGGLDVAALGKALDEVVRRHESLRTTFAVEDGRPVQVIADNSIVPLPLADLAALADDRREREVAARIIEEASRPFDLARGPLIRAWLLRLGEAEHVAVLNLHHSVADGLSIAVLIREWSTLYDAFARGLPSPLPGLSVQYTDFARWQEARLRDDEVGRQLDRRVGRLGGVPVLELPTDHPRPAEPSRRAGSRRLTLPTSTAEALRGLARREGVTPFMALLAGFQVLLRRHSGQDDFAVGTPVAGRSRPEFEPLIGLFVNSLVLRADLSGGPSFRDLLGRVRRETIGAIADADVPFEHLVGALRPGRDTGHAPLFQVMFVYLDDPLRELRTTGLTIVPIEVDSPAAKFDLTLFASETPRGLRLLLEYDADLFDAATIDRMLARYRALLDAAVADPDRPVAELAILPEPERQLLLREWNATRADYPRDLPAHRLFEAQAARTPDAAAVRFRDQTLTYRELDARANRLAHHLGAAGVGRGMLVAIGLDRSPEMVVGLLGVLKAGAAYVPLDPGYPPERLGFMMADSGASVLLTRSSLRPRLPAHGATVVDLDADAGPIGARPAHAPSVATGPDDLAYVIYTSGSTGRPKGAMIAHRGLTNYLAWAVRAYNPAGGRGAPVHSSFSFDLTVTSLFAPLLSGSRVDLLPEDRGVEALAEALRAVGDYSLVKLTPAHLQLLGQQLGPGEAAGRTRAFVVGGEPLTDEHLAFWRDHAPATEIVNEYGPTETVVGCAVERVPAGEAGPGAMAIGRPIANTRLYVLDPRMHPTPIGVPGELFVGGDGVARGYLGRPALTADRFGPDPFGPPGARLYRTGDRARWRGDGRLEFLGRLDDQVKVRGYRVELGEVEAALARQPSVREAAAVAREDGRLVGYVAPRPGHPFDPDALRRDLARVLPDYMVPSAIVAVDALPLTPNGKVDRKALPAPGPIKPAGPAEATGGPVEEALARVVAEVLGHEAVGPRDNLFDLGIDSILVIQVVSGARRVGLRINPGQVFRHPTVAELAALVEPVEAVEAVQGPVVGPVPLTPIQRWFFDQDLPDPHHFNQCLLLEASPTPDPDRLRDALAALIRHHDALRLRFRRDDTGWSQHGEPPSDEAPLDLVDLSALPEEEQAAAIEAGAARLQAGLDLEHGPLIRAALFDLGPACPARLLLVVHHLAVDGVSWRILLEDLATLLGRGDGSGLPAKTTSFRRWAELLVRHARSPATLAERDYWLGEARSPTSPLPTDLDKGRDPGLNAAAALAAAELDEDDTRALLQEVPRALHATINDALLTALALALGEWTGQVAWRVDLEGHGREEIAEGLDLSRTVGWFTTIHPVRLALPVGRDPAASLRSVKEQLRKVPRRGIGYGLLPYLSDDPTIAEAMRSATAAEVAFNYLGQLDGALPAASGFAPARESVGPSRAPEGRRTHLLDGLGGVVGGRLRFDWTYNPGVHRRETVERFAGGFVAALRSIVGLARAADVGGYTPSDFPLAGLDQSTLDRALGGERGIEDVYPPTPLQEGMLFRAAYAPDSGAYVQQWTCTLRGDLDRPAFEAAWRAVVGRHPALRTSIHWVDSDRPMQVVRRRVDPPLEVLDWRDVPADGRDRRLSDHLDADRTRGFVLSTAPLVRLALIRLDEDVHQLLFTYHHMVLDGWCMPIVLGEALALYEAGRLGVEADLPSRRPYRDYVAWLLGQDPARSEAYWRGVLGGFRASTPLGIEGPDAPAPAGARGEQYARLSAAATADIQRFARAQGLTLNTMLQGAWALLLGRYGGTSDVVFGVTVSGRQADLPGIEGMIGLFINTLPTRVRVDEGASLVPWLRDIQSGQVVLREHEQSPLVSVQGWGDVPRGRPLFESILVFENYPVDAALEGRAGGLGFEPGRVLERTDFPLTLMVAPDAELSIRADYDARRLGDAGIGRMLARLVALLEAMAADPSRRLGDLPMLSGSDRDELLRLSAGAEDDGLDGLSVEELDLLIGQLSEETKPPPYS